MKIEHYHRAIEIVSQDRNWKELVIKLAKLFPDVLCEIVDGHYSSLDLEIIRYCKNGDRISAIKLYRAAKECGLKDAKDYIDELCPVPTRG